MEAGQMIDVYEFNGSGFTEMMRFEGWRIGFLRSAERFSTVEELERHNKTDEAFILLEGSAVLYTDDMQMEMEKCKIYNIKKGVWHHITVSEDATVMVVENSDTSGENSEKKSVCEK